MPDVSLLILKPVRSETTTLAGSKDHPFRLHTRAINSLAVTLSVRNIYKPAMQGPLSRMASARWRI
jgi:hypothetical protein